MKAKADPENIVACNASPGPMVLSFRIYRLQMRIPAGTVAAIVATIAVWLVHSILYDEKEVRELTETMDHYTVHQADKVCVGWNSGCSICQYHTTLWMPRLTQQQSRVIHPSYTKRQSLNMPTWLSASLIRGAGQRRLLRLTVHLPPGSHTIPKTQHSTNPAD